jgi:hypothetical protein
MLNAFALPNHVALCRSTVRSGLLEMLICEFRSAFTDIEYEVDTQTRILNAQAFSQGGKRFVRIYGGLAFHPLVSHDALIFTLLHETGHHRARGRRFAGDPRLACDCIADRWAVGAGVKALHCCSGRRLNLSNALDSLDLMIASIGAGQASAGWMTRSRRLQDCWSGSWALRRSRLNGEHAPVPTGSCYYS